MVPQNTNRIAILLYNDFEKNSSKLQFIFHKVKLFTYTVNQMTQLKLSPKCFRSILIAYSFCH